MCGIIAGVAGRNVAPILLEGLKRLEYRGYDSAGLAIVAGTPFSRIQRLRLPGKVAYLAKQLQEYPIEGRLGVAHTRWATHGKPSEENAHPHMSGEDLAIVHNGIIENHEALRLQLQEKGYAFYSETDTEVIAHLLQEALKEKRTLVEAVQKTVAQLQGLYAVAVVCAKEPKNLVVARKGSPLVIGVGIGEHFVASDMLALLPVTETMIVLQDGDVAALDADACRIWDQQGQIVERARRQTSITAKTAERGAFRHFMQKEMFEQPQALSDAMMDRLGERSVMDAIFGIQAEKIFDTVEAVHFVACGTSYHAGLIGEYWIETLAGIPARAFMASEFRGRKPVALKNTLLVTISQSGETADTLAVLRGLEPKEYCGTLTICNVPESSLVRSADMAFLSCAGPEIGVASTKGFTTQLIGLFLLGIVLGRRQGMRLSEEKHYIEALKGIPALAEAVLQKEAAIAKMAEYFENKTHAIFLGRGLLYPVALEGALKLKEISYVYAQGYTAGELKHGPLALIDAETPVVISMADDALLAKLKSNLEEIEARGGELFIFADEGIALTAKPHRHVIELPKTIPLLAPILHVIPLQLLAYSVALLKGTDVDQPRNLAKSVTVE